MNSVDFVRVAWFGKHFGEEPPLVGGQGAGAIFFTGCNLRCVYCQNYQISQQNLGRNYSVPELAQMMLDLQRDGALNIDLVTPTIWAEPIKRAVLEAKKQGLKIPVVWNSNAYESQELIQGLEGIVDIYLPDFKYGSNELAKKYSGVDGYVEKARESIREMLKQVGHLKLSPEGLAEKGLIVRHLILPNQIGNTFKVLEEIRQIDQDVFINLLSQYELVHHAKEFPELDRNVSAGEAERAFNKLVELGFKNGWVQDLESHDFLLPDFTKADPFGMVK